MTVTVDDITAAATVAVIVLIAADLAVARPQADLLGSSSLHHLASSIVDLSSSSSVSVRASRFLVSAGITTWARITAHVPPFP